MITHAGEPEKTIIMSSEAGQLFPNKGQGHSFYMEMALKQAASAFKQDEVPIGAVVIQGNAVVGRGYNQRESLKTLLPMRK